MSARWLGKCVLAAAAFVGALADFDSPTWSFVATAQAAEANPCSNSMGKDRKRCRIDVKVVDDGAAGCKVEIPDQDQRELVLKGQSDLRIIWRLNTADGSYLFCRYTGDGVFLTDPVRQADGQVLAMRVMKTRERDNNDSEDEFQCSPRFRWTFRNDVEETPAATQYNYGIKVRSKDFARKCSFDPFIKNG